VPQPGGGLKPMAALKKMNAQTTFIDPQDPTAPPLIYKGIWRRLSPVYKPDAQWHNFVDAWNQLNFPRLFMNSLIIAGFGTLGAVASSLFVAYGFARFNFRPALTAVCLFHFFFAWNDFFSPLVYLASKPELWPLSVGLQKFNAIYGRQPNLLQTGALITLVLPVTIFFLAQRVFMQGIVFTGVEK
jgi:ABC-type glycerol-3-phosphate transport system permease component